MSDQKVCEKLIKTASEQNLDILNGKVCRTSSRFCFGVEHGDYNGTELFGVGTDRFIWLAFKPNHTNKINIYSGNFPQEGVVSFSLGEVPDPQSPQLINSWARFPWGVNFVLQQEGISLHKGFDAVLYGNIPGGGMSRSASLSLNLLLTFLEVNTVRLADEMKIVDLAQAVETTYIGSPCGKLDQVMIYFAKAGKGIHYNPKNNSIQYVALGENAIDFRLVALDTGTKRDGLENSTYKKRRAECEELVALCQQTGCDITCLADIKEESVYRQITAQFNKDHSNLIKRLTYIYEAQKRFPLMLRAWKTGDIKTVGQIFREDGLGLRDQYQISGPELEAMCDIARSVPGVLGERMLGGGDKGASGAIVKTEAVEQVRRAIQTIYPQKRPNLGNKYAVHVCSVVDGVTFLTGLL